MSVKFNYKLAESFISEEEVKNLAPMVLEAHKMLHEKTGAGNENKIFIAELSDENKNTYNVAEVVLDNELKKHIILPVKDNCKNISLKENGYVTTILGRRRDVNEINSSSYMEREFGKRVAMNTPIQGSAADIIKVAMIKINDYLKENNYESKMILQIHDELVFDIKEEEKEVLVPTLTKMMEEASNLTVKLVAESGMGKDWYSAK